MERSGVGLRIVTFCAVALLGGCNDTQTTKLQTVGSPDGRWIVESQLARTSGPGTDGVSAEVYMSASSDPKDRFLILSITEPADTSGAIMITWKDKNTLELSLPKEARIGFQVVRVGGNIDIHTVK
jgi:hypothetical protein